MKSGINRCPAEGLVFGKAHNPRTAIGYIGLRDEDEGTYVGWYAFNRWHNLPMRLSLRNHSPDGFEWRYHGGGPAQLALALLCHATRNPALTLELYQTFKRKIVSRLHWRRWHLSQAFILSWVRRQMVNDGNHLPLPPSERGCTG